MKDLQSRWNLLVVLAALTTLVGCGALQADPRSPQQNQRDNDGLSANGRTLSFGSVVIGNKAQATEYIYNPTPSSVTINEATPSTAQYQVVSPSFPVTLASHQGIALVVNYTPTAPGRSSATILISSNAPQPSMTVPASAQAIAPGKLVVAPATISFGNVQVGKSQWQAESFTNTGGTSVTVSQVALSNGNFVVSGLTLPLTVSPGRSVGFHVGFTPKAGGRQNGSVSAHGSASLVSPYSSVPGTAQTNAEATPSTSETEAASITVTGMGTQAPNSDATLGQITAAPASLSFGNPVTGSTQNQSLVITNTGTASVTLTQAAASGAGYTLQGPSLPLTLSGNQTATFSVTFAPTTAGAANGTVSIISSAANPSLNVVLSATPVGPGTLTISSNPVSFGTIAVGSTQKTSATVTNSGGSSVTLMQATVTGTDFSMNTMGMPMTLAPNQSATVTISCAPKSAGTLSGSLAITSNASNANVAVPLVATAVAGGALTITPSTVSFGSVPAGSTQNVPATLTNSGGSSVTITQASFTGGGYSATGLTLPLTLQAGQSAPFSIVFAPQSAGTDNFSLSIMSNASNPSLTVPVSGTATAAAALAASAASLSFGKVTIGSTQILPETLTNSGGAPITVTQVAAGAGFTVSGLALPATLNAGQSTSFTVAFAPQSAGSSTVNLALTNNGPNTTFAIPLSGTGVAPGTLSGSSVSFGSVQVGSSSTQNATLTNSGGASVTVTQASLSVSGTDFTFNGLTLPLTLSAGQSFTFGVTFAPQSTGSAADTIALVSNGAGGTPVISLSGTGTAAGEFSVNPGSFSFGTVAVGASKTLPATVSATGSSVTITSASVNSAEFALKGPNLPVTIAAGGTASFTLTFTPQASGAASTTVSFATNGTGSPVTESVTGSGTPAPQHSVGLSWNPSTSSSVASYNVYRGSVAGGPYAKLTSTGDSSTSFTDSSVQAGQTYYYVTTSVGSDGMESTYSNQVSAVIPTP